MDRAICSTLLLFISFFTHAQPVINIGAPLPFNSSLAIEANKQKRGYDLWAQMINAKGGIKVGNLKHCVKIIYITYKLQDGMAREAVESLIKNNHIDLLFAPYGSKAARDASAVAEKNKIPMIAVTASSRQAYSRGHEYIFGIFTPNKTLIEPLLDLVQNQSPNISNIALFIRKDLFPLSIAREVVKSSKDRGISINVYKTYDPNIKNFTKHLQEIEHTHLDWVFALGYTKDLVLLRKAMAKRGISSSVMTMIAAPAYQEFIDTTGSLSENITSSAWWHPAVQYNSQDIFGSTANFVNLFRSRYDKTPDYVEASAALAGVLFQHAVERAGSLNGQQIRKELANFNETTFWGPINFGKDGQNQGLSPLVFQIQNSKATVIFPKNIATGSLKITDQQTHE